MAEIRVYDWTVKRAYSFDREGGGLFQQGLHRSTVFADYIAVIASRLAVPVFVFAAVETAFREGSEFAETVCAVECSVKFIEGYHNLRPVDHRCGHEFETVFAQLQHLAFFHRHCAAFK